MAYVEVLDAANRPVLQGKVALKQAAGQGSFVLPAALAAGSYTVRAYTSWMKNFSPEAYFHSPVTVINTVGRVGGAPPPIRWQPTRPGFFRKAATWCAACAAGWRVKVTDKAGQGVAAAGKVLEPARRGGGHVPHAAAGHGLLRFHPARHRGLHGRA